MAMEETDYDKTARRLLAALIRHKNGVTVDAMNAAGVHYDRNYGVPLPEIKRQAAGFATDHGFARYLYTTGTRELMLAAIRMAEPGKADTAELPFWTAGIVNAEMAENLSLFLAQTGVADEAVREYTAEDKDTVTQYCGLLVALRTTERATEAEKELYRHIADRFTGSPTVYLSRTAQALKEKL